MQSASKQSIKKGYAKDYLDDTNKQENNWIFLTFLFVAKVLPVTVVTLELMTGTGGGGNSGDNKLLSICLIVLRNRCRSVRIADAKKVTKTFCCFFQSAFLDRACSAK